MKRLILSLTLVTVLVSSIFAQTNGQTVRGVVIDAFAGNPLPGATIVILDTNPIVGVTTDENGEFSFKNIQPGRWSFACSFMGFNSQSIANVMVSSGKESMLTFKLTEKVTRLNDIVVSAKSSKEKPRNESALISARAFSVEETERFAGSLGDPARMVANYAGVVTGNDSRNDIVIRGNSPMGLLWRLEGVDVPNPNHFGAQGTTGGPVSMLNSNLLANSDFMTGAFPAEYGNALSGVFDVNLRSGNKEKYEFTGQVGFNGFEAAAEGPISLGKGNPKGSFIADYRYSTLQFVSKMGMDLGTGTAIPEYQDFSFLADIPTKKLGRFKLIGLYGNSFIRLGRSFDQNEVSSHSQLGYAVDFGAGLNITALTHTLMINEDTRFKSSVSFQKSTSTTISDTIDYINKNYFTQYAGILDESKLSASTQFKHRFSTKNNLTIGVTANHYITLYNDSIYMKKYHKYISLTEVNDEQSLLLESYANWQHKFSDVLTLNLGLHHQYYDLNKENIVEPRFGLQWQATTNQTVSLGYGLHSQIQPRTTYFYKGYNDLTGQYSQNNRDLKSTKSQHFVLGYDVHLGKEFRVKAETYYQDISNVPVSKSNPEFSMLNNGSGYYIPTLDSLENKGKGRNYGVELTLEKFLSNGYYALMTVSIYDSKYQGYDQKWRNTAFNSNYAVNLLAGYEWKVGKNNFLTFDLRTAWSGGKPRTPIDLVASVAAGEEKYDLTKVYSDKFKDYLRTDLRIGFKMNGKRFSQEWGLDLQNVTDHQNIFGEQYNAVDRKVATVYQQGFMPMMLYRVNF
ncbi:MAG: TonB-dependent receptor [Bacteroidales bacterium]|nr:TonB-dependent receptor [Bacteroidales bacterium]